MRMCSLNNGPISNCFQPWNDNRLCRLFPEAYEAQRKLAEEGHGDEAGELAFATQRFGFLCGILVDCKSMGATRDQLLEKAQAFGIVAMARAEREAKEEEKKAEEARKEQVAAERRREMTAIDGGRKETNEAPDHDTLKGEFKD
jgi:hypothetical protein